MLKYLLDSNIVSESSKPYPNKNVIETLTKKRNECCICTVTYFEMLHGVLRLDEGKRKERLMAYLNETVLPFYNQIPYDSNAAEMHAQIVSDLEKVGKTMPFQDSIIAAIAMANDLVLVTRNVKDFENAVSECSLKMENWFE